MLKLIQSKSCFERHIVILLLFCLVDVIALFSNINLPLSILYGPLLYLGFKSAIEYKLSHDYLHILPFLLFLFTYVLIHLGEQLSISWVSTFHQYYDIIYKIALPISLLSYSAILVFSYRKNKSINPLKERGIRKVHLISVFSLLLSVLLAIKIVWPSLTFGVNYSLIVYSFLIVTIFIIAYHLFLPLYKNEPQSTAEKTQKQHLYGGINEEELRMKLHECLEESKLYLNSNLTLDMLAEKIGLSKHHLSHFLNTYIGKSFYQIIAEYRITHAKNRLNEDVSITIETLAYECGFNSKTTLNKYFKELTGFAPSEYRSGMVSKQLSLR